ncbi:MAG: pseudaminic acid cytidylyltransferase [Bacteroidales bacterium]|nr:pseudaminic acid cytidylyltransferase [Bacteroidales bacterium]
MNNLAIIPARGGSKRIPRKNIKVFLGKPIIAYSIEIALKSGLFEEVMVSTDDEEIAGIAIQYGAKVPFIRSEKSSSDYASTMDVLNEVTVEYKVRFNKVFDYICCIYATSPLIKLEHISKGYYMIKEKNYNSVYPIVPFSYPVWRGVKINESGRTEMVWPEYINARTQDLDLVYHDAGQWYWFNPKKVINSLFTDNSSSIVLSEEEVQDIDTLNDWNLAEMKYQFMQKSKLY